MILEVKRKTESSKSIVGELWIDGQLECFTLEPSRLNPYHQGHPCVDAGGPYEIQLTLSPKMHYVTPEVLNVPGRSEIRLHVGNFPKDTEGCTLVGETKGTDQIYRSQIAFDQLMTLLKTSLDPITITYYDPVS
jgi:hypothetical protein